MELSNALAQFSGALGATVLVLAVVSYLLNVNATRRSLRAIRRANVSSALENPNLESLRSYIQDELRDVRVADYVNEDTVRADFDQLVTQVASFVDGPAQTSPNEPDAERPRPRPRPGRMIQAEMVPELAPAAEDFLQGEIWNGLARLRRIIELRLQEQFGPGAPIARGAGRLLQLAERQGFVGRDWVDQLQYAISVCNRGVHGDPVSEGEAWEALGIVNAWWGQKA